MIWAPTWVDAFAPSDMLTQWYSYLQASVPAGVMVGYLTGMTALFIGGGQDTMYILPFVQVAPWRVPFFLQVVAMGPLAWTLMKIPREHIDTKLVFGIADPKAPTPVVSKAASGARSDSSDFLNPDGSRPRRDSLPADMTFIESLQCGKYMSDLRNVFNPIFICVTLGLSGLYFVVTGVQFWSTDFIISECGGKPQVVMPLFVFTSITAPVGGVLAGGWFIDRMGGYRDDRGTVKSLGLMVIGGSVAVAAAIPASFLSNPYPIFVLIWILLFFGGGVLPAATGINIGSVLPQYRTAANSFSLICFNMLGYFGAPFISGIVMKAYGSYRAGYRTCLSASAFSMIMFLFAYAAAKRNLRESGGAKTGKFSELTESDHDPETKENALSLDPLTEKQARV
jgi:MFS family permease